MPRPACDPAIGPALEAARAETPPVRWKVLEQRFGLTRRQLYRILLEQRAKGWG
jgi:hypothetical protein